MNNSNIRQGNQGKGMIRIDKNSYSPAVIPLPRQFFILALCLLPFALSMTGCREKTATAEQAPVSVKVKAVEMNSVSNGVRYSANIIPNSQVELAFKVGGYVERVLQMRGVDGRMRDVQA